MQLHKCGSVVYNHYKHNYAVRYASAARRSSTRANAIQIAEHAAYVSEVAVVSCPKRLPALLKVLEVQGHTLLSPSDRAGLHPLVIPLSSTAAGDQQQVFGLLRWPQPNQHKAMPLPLVSMSRGGRNLTLQARSVDEYLHRLLAEEDFSSGPGQIREAAGDDGYDLYSPGGVEAAGFAGKLNLYLIRKVGMFPDVCEGLSLGHLAKGDETAAMVASEWYMRNNHFPGWGRPYEFAAELFQKIGRRGEEARDMARYALRNPWWSLSNFAATRAASELQGSAKQVHWQLSEAATAASTAQVTGFNYKEPKTEEQLALEEAAELLDLAASGEEGGYSSITPQLADAYQRAGLTEVANFIKAAS
eukprot:gene5352-5588_t